MLQIVHFCNPADRLSDMTSNTALLQQCTSFLCRGDSSCYKHTWCNLSTVTNTWIRIIIITSSDSGTGIVQKPFQWRRRAPVHTVMQPDGSVVGHFVPFTVVTTMHSFHWYQMWRLVLRIRYSYNFMGVAFGFAHPIQLQFYECRVWFCASNTVTIFMSVALSFAHKIQLQRHICNIVINYNGHRISCTVSITLHLYDRN
jgi:hypothetical protein